MIKIIFLKNNKKRQIAPLQKSGGCLCRFVRCSQHLFVKKLFKEAVTLTRVTFSESFCKLGE